MILILSLVLLVLLSALAVKHVADILLYGSIFQPLRSFIARKETEGSSLFGVLHQLFTCLLCMSTQVSVWLAGVPALIITWNLHESIWLSLLSAIVATMAVAALGMGLWTFLEYSPNRFHARGKELEEANRKIRELTIMLQASPTVSSVRTEASFEVFFSQTEYFDFLDYALTKCKNIGCSIRRHFCQVDRIAEFYASWAKKYPEAARDWPLMERALQRVSSEYFLEATYFRRTESEVNELKSVSYENLKQIQLQ